MEKKNYNLVIGFIVLTLIILVEAIAGRFVGKPDPNVIQGEVDATEVRVSGKIAGRIESFAVKLGDTVHEGDTLVYIDSPEILAKIAQATAAQAKAAASTTWRSTGRGERTGRASSGWGGYCSGEVRSICLYTCLSHYTS